MATDQKSVSFSLKDELFNKDRVRYLADLFHAADTRFDVQEFVRGVMKSLKRLELKQRIVHIASVLENHLASDYRVAAKQIVTALPPRLDPTKSDNDFGDFIFAPLGEFVVRNGLDDRHVKLSLRTLRELTQRFSMEDAIRYFINEHPNVTLSTLQEWATDKNYHVRRLVSEGTRAMLPWSKRLSIDVLTPLPLLDTLHADPTRYVTRSVSNHLNDIAKTHPQQVVAILKRWKKANLQDAAELQWMSKRALRTLVKRGDQRALLFLGFRPDPRIEVSEFTIHSPSIRPGQAVEFSCDIVATRNESLIVDYVIEFVKSNGNLAPKVHKLKQLSLSKGESVSLKKKHTLRANATTYTLYPGKHFVTLQINGKSFGRKPFQLTC